jgi:hypothetical protein
VIAEMIETPKLLIRPWTRGEPFSYICSVCGQPFLLPEDRAAKEAMEELLEAFKEHIREIHSDGQEPGRHA